MDLEEDTETFQEKEFADNLSEVSINSFSDSDDFSSGSSDEPTDSEESDGDCDIEWSDFDSPKDHIEFKGVTGPRVFPKNKKCVRDVVKLFIGDDLFELIANETNVYYKQYAEKNQHNKEIVEFPCVTPEELKKWFSLTLYMGFSSFGSIDEYWIPDRLFDMPIFRRTMDVERYRQILYFLHFCDNSTLPENSDRLYKVEPVANYFSKKFRENFNPGSNIYIDEDTIPWRVTRKRRSRKWRNFYDLRVSKHGVRIQMLFDSTAKYILNFKLYPTVHQVPKHAPLEVLAYLSGKWHNLYMENTKINVQFIENVFNKKIRLCANIRQKCRFPTKLKKIKLKTNESAFQRRKEIIAQVCKVSSRKTLRIISTIHNAELVETERISRKTKEKIKYPKCFIDYGDQMKGIYPVRKFLDYFPLYKKNIKWSKKVVLYLFSCALLNSFVLYQQYNGKSKKMKFDSFLLKVFKVWLNDNETARKKKLQSLTTPPVV